MSALRVTHQPARRTNIKAIRLKSQTFGGFFMTNVDNSRPQGNNPAALPLTDAARLLARLSRQPITPEMLAADQSKGAPRNADGTVNLVNYAAWLVKEGSDAA